MHKYAYKGNDAASVNITNTIDGSLVIEHDEISAFVDARYLSASEAVCRILGKKLHDKSHTVIRLPVHLPNDQNIVIRCDPDESDMVNPVHQVSMLIDYFSLNQRDPEARQYCYIDTLNIIVLLNVKLMMVQKCRCGLKENKVLKSLVVCTLLALAK